MTVPELETPVLEFDDLLKSEFDEVPKVRREHSSIIVRYTCGRTRLIDGLCSDPLCVPCAKVRANRLRARWGPVVKRMRAPRSIILTQASDFSAEAAKRDFMASFRRLLDLRLGADGLAELVAGALDFVRNPPSALKGDERLRFLSKARLWERRIEMFKTKVERLQGRRGKLIRFRALIGKGFANEEMTYSYDCGFHFHRHLTFDGAFIPWPVLVAAWMKATQGKGKIVYIQEVDKSDESIEELIKYICKPWEIPSEKADEVRAALRGSKRIWPLGGAKPVDVKPLCPFCKKPDCRAHRASGLVTIIQSGTLEDGTRFRIAYDQRAEKSFTFYLHNGIWEGDDPLDLIPCAVACHSGSSPSPPSPPGVQLRLLLTDVWN